MNRKQQANAKRVIEAEMAKLGYTKVYARRFAKELVKIMVRDGVK